MISPIALSIVIFTISVVSPFNDPRCKRLSNGCVIKSYFCHTQMESFCYFYICDKIDLNFQFAKAEIELIRNCSSNKEVGFALDNVYFQLSKASFLDSTFDLFNNEFFFNLGYQTDEVFYMPGFETFFSISNKITFRYIKGFDSGAFKKINIDYLFQMDFYYSNFDFYLNRSLIRSCDDIDPENIPKYVFYSFSRHIGIIRFINSEYKTKTCPLLFLNMNIDTIEFNGIQNTFYKTNFPRFLSISNSTLNTSNIFPYYLFLINMQNIELNSLILNDFLFSEISDLRLFGDIVSIEKGLFKSFKNLKEIELDIISMRKLFHHGIDWVFDLNSDINGDIYNISSFDDSSECVLIYINSFSNDKRTIQSLNFNFMDYIPNEDFCLYAQFPFQQLIILKFGRIRNEIKYNTSISCTYLWFVYHFQIFGNYFCSSEYFPINNLKEKIDECNFKQR